MMLLVVAPEATSGTRDCSRPVCIILVTFVSTQQPNSPIVEPMYASGKFPSSSPERTSCSIFVIRKDIVSLERDVQMGSLQDRSWNLGRNQTRVTDF